MINWKLKTRDQRPIGLDIGHNSIKMIQLEINGGHIRVLAADKVCIDPRINSDAEQRRSFTVSMIKQMLAEGNFRGRNVVSCLPNGKLKITSLRLAEGASDEIEQALRKEVAQRFGLDADKDAVNYVIAGDVRQGDEIKNELILFAADSESVKKHIALLEEAGLRPVGVDVVPCALFRSFERSLRRQEDREHTTVFVDVGSRFTTVVFGRGGGISFVKQIPIGGDSFSREVASKLGVGISEAQMLRGTLRAERLDEDFESQYRTILPTSTETGVCTPESGAAGQNGLDESARQVMIDAVSAVAEKLAREISLCFRYHSVTFRGKCVKQAFITGGGAYDQILLNVLRRQLAVDIEVAQPLRGFDSMNINFDCCKRGTFCEYAVAVGLSLKGWDGDSDSNGNYERN